MNHSVSCNVYSIPARTCNCGFDLKPDPLVADLRDQLAQYVSKVADLQAQLAQAQLAQAVEAKKKKSATMTCECPIQSTCRLPPLHPGVCMDEADIELAALRAKAEKLVTELAKVHAQLAQAVEAKKSATTMSEERLARALRAEDRIQLRAELADDGALQAATARADEAEDRAKNAESKLAEFQRSVEAGFAAERADRTKAEDRAKRAENRVKDLEAVKEMMEATHTNAPLYDAIGLKGSNRCLNGVQTAVRAMEVRAADAERSRVWAETQATKALARADAAEARVRGALDRAEDKGASAEQQKLEDGVEEAMRRLDGIAGEITTMRKRLKGSLE